MKIRMLIDIPGLFENIEGGVKRGDIVEVSDENGERYIATPPIATAKLKGELPPAYEPSEESEMLRDAAMKRVAAQCHNPAFDPRPNSGVIYTPRPRVRNDGWGV